MDFYEITAIDLAKGLKDGNITADDVIKNYIDKVDSNQNLFSVNFKEQAGNKLKNMTSLGKLAGVPVAIDDNISITDVPMTCGSKAMEDYVSPYNATIIDRLEKNGLVLVGKLKIQEFGTENSDCSSAKAVSEGLVPMAISLNDGKAMGSKYGVIVFRPSGGTVSRYGIFGVCTSFGQANMVGKTVEDVNALFDAVSGYDDLDGISLAVDYSNIAEIKTVLPNLKIGFLTEAFAKEICSDDIKALILSAIDLLKNNGATIHEFSFSDYENSRKAYQIILDSELSSNMGKYDGSCFGYRADNITNWEDMFVKSRSQSLTAAMQKRIMLGTYFLSTEGHDKFYRRAKAHQTVVATKINQILSDCDVVITPVVGGAEDGGKSTTVFTALPDLLGLPSIVVPCGNVNGKAVGMQIFAKALNDSMVLSVANLYENISPVNSILGGKE